jgi:hypothetical protein
MKSLLIMAFSILLVCISQETAFGKLNIGYNSRYDSTYGFVKYDSTSQWGKARIFSGENVMRLINQELVLKKQRNERPFKVDLRIRKSNFERNDISSIYKCCDTSELGTEYERYYTNYKKASDIRYEVVGISQTRYFANWHTSPYNLDDSPDSETFILSLKPSNEDTIVYYWFHPLYAHIGEFELNGFIEKTKKKYIGKKYVLSWIPYEFSEKGLDIMDKWECIDINFSASDFFQSVTLKNSKGDKIDLRLYEYFIPELKGTIYTEEKADYFLKKYKKKLWEATLNRELQLGMPSELVSEIWRTPDNISKKMTKAKTTQKWEYSDGSYLVFENDKLTEVFNADD